MASLRGLLAGYDWRDVLMKGGPKAFVSASKGAANYLRSPGNQPVAGEETLASKYRRFPSQLARAWALCSGSETLAELRPEVQGLLGNLIASATSSGEVLDIYEAAGMPKPSLGDLTPEFIAKTQQARNPQLAIERLVEGWWAVHSPAEF